MNALNYKYIIIFLNEDLGTEQSTDNYRNLFHFPNISFLTMPYVGNTDENSSEDNLNAL